jgi:hypothetical protein
VISLSTAKKLRDAGLRWEPKEGDYCYYDEKLDLLAGENLASTVKLHNLITKNPEYQDMGPIWVPSLDQLLGEIEARGFRWDVSKYSREHLASDKDRSGAYGCQVESSTDVIEFTADTPEEAAGRALLWVLTEGRGE